MVHFMISIGDYQTSDWAPCGRRVVGPDPNAIASSNAEELSRVTCPDCQKAIRRLGALYNHDRRNGHISKDWGK